MGNLISGLWNICTPEALSAQMITPTRVDTLNDHTVITYIILTINLLRRWRRRSGTRILAMIWGRRTDTEGKRRREDLEDTRARAGLTDTFPHQDIFDPRSSGDTVLYMFAGHPTCGATTYSQQLRHLSPFFFCI